MKHTLKLLPVFLLLLGLGWLGSEQRYAESAYTLTGVSWSGTSANYRVNTNFPASSGSNAQVLSALQAGADAWTTQACSNFQFNYLGSTTTTSTAPDGNNAVFWTSASGGGALASTTYWFSGNNLTNFDIRFYGNHTWSTSPSGGQFDIQGVAAHEFGHAAGIDHSTLSPNSNATMNSTTGSGGASIAQRSLEQEDIDAIIFLYGADPACGAQPGFPTPNPMSFLTAPNLLSTSLGLMVATGATAPAPVEYFFEYTGSHAGGDNSSWQSAANYVDPGLQPNGFYSYRVKARNAAFPIFETAYSASSGFHVPAAVPGAVSFSEVTNHEVTIDSIDGNGNLPHTIYAVEVNGLYVNASGALQAVEFYQTAASWAGTVVTGLARETAHTIRCKARDFLLVETAFGPSSMFTTELLSACGHGNLPDGLGGIQDDVLKINGSAGDVNHRVFVTPGTPLTISMDQPLGYANPANWVLWGHSGTPADNDEFDLPASIGRMCITPCEFLMFPEHFTLMSTYGDLGCGLLLPAALTPYSLTLPGIAISLPPIAFQGIIEEGPGSLAVTNTVIWINQ